MSAFGLFGRVGIALQGLGSFRAIFAKKPAPASQAASDTSAVEVPECPASEAEISFEECAMSLLEPTEFDRMRPGMDRALEMGPALFKHKRSGLEFCVAAKFLDRTLLPRDSHGLIKILNENQKKELFGYSRQLKAPCFLVVGVGDAPDSIDRMALIPLEMVENEGMQLREIMGNERYQKDPITFIELAECHATCGEVDASPRFLVNACEIFP